jgi:hypothetical protein
MAAAAGRRKINRDEAEVVTQTGQIRAGSWAGPRLWAARAVHDCHQNGPYERMQRLQG